MLTLTIRTDKPEAEIGLYQNGMQLQYVTWQAHRQLAETIHIRIHDMLKVQNKSLKDIEAIVCFQGPGSFTGLRIGLTVANTLAYSLQIPIVAQLDIPPAGWIEGALHRLKDGESDVVAMPEYGAAVNITLPKIASAP